MYFSANVKIGNLQVDPQDQTGPDLETRIDELRANIRRSEISKAKYEARLECLRAGAAPVDEWLKELELLSVVETLPRSSSLLSVRTDASNAVSVFITYQLIILKYYTYCCDILYLHTLFIISGSAKL